MTTRDPPFGAATGLTAVIRQGARIGMIWVALAVGGVRLMMPGCG
jgi:hypothetical protein